MEPDDFSFLRGLAQPEKKKRKRGGLAGIWDRNKNIITPLATGALGFATGGLALPALAGAAMRGLDRPGKRGIGFDAGQGLRGAAEGALAGSAGRGLKGILSAPAAAPVTPPSTPPSTPAVPSAPAVGGEAQLLEGRMAASRMATSPASPTMAPQAAPAVGGSAVPSMLGRLGDMGQSGARGILKFIRDNPEAAGMGLQGLSGIMGVQSQRRLEEERQREERRRAENLARLVMPMYLESMQGRGGR